MTGAVTTKLAQPPIGARLRRQAATFRVRELTLIPAIVLAIIAGTMAGDRKSTRLNSSHLGISYAVFCFTKTRWPAAFATLRKRRGLRAVKKTPITTTTREPIHILF